jgi:hypothetical protein
VTTIRSHVGSCDEGGGLAWTTLSENLGNGQHGQYGTGPRS